MRSIAAIIASAIVSTAALSAAPCAAPNLPANGKVLRPPSSVVVVDARCAKGWHWVPAGYARRGKWRAAHCARD